MHTAIKHFKNIDCSEIYPNSMFSLWVTPSLDFDKHHGRSPSKPLKKSIIPTFQWCITLKNQTGNKSIRAFKRSDRFKARIEFNLTTPPKFSQYNS